MEIAHIFAVGVALAGSFVAVGNANAQVLYDNLAAASQGVESANQNSTGPLFNSFSTSGSSFFLNDVSLFVNATNPADGGEFALGLFVDPTTFPIYSSPFLFDSMLSSALSVETFPVGVLLDPNTRYWVGLDAVGNSSLNWSFASDVSGPGVADEYWFDASGVYANAGGRGPFQMTVGTPTAVLEPSTWAMMLVGFAAVGFAGYRASRKTGAPLEEA